MNAPAEPGSLFGPVPFTGLEALDDMMSRAVLVLIPGQGKQAGIDLLTEAYARNRAADELADRIAVLSVAWFGGTPEAAEQAHEWAQASPVLAGEPAPPS